MSTEKKQTAASDAPGSSVPTKQSAIFVFGTMADTTWRLFVPTIGATLLGVWGDKSFTTKPWLTITGITLGAAIAVLLVRQQLKADGGVTK